MLLYRYGEGIKTFFPNKNRTIKKLNMKKNETLLVNRDFAESCWSLGLEALDTEQEGVYELRQSDFIWLRLQGYLRHLSPEDWKPE